MRVKFEDRELLPAKWGLVNSWAKDAKRAAAQINARAETVATIAAFREAFKASAAASCPPTASSSGPAPRTRRRPSGSTAPTAGIMLFAGLYESWPATDDQWQRTFTIVTTRANALMEPIHDRMPVILDEADADAWLDPNPATSTPSPAPRPRPRLPPHRHPRLPSRQLRQEQRPRLPPPPPHPPVAPTVALRA